MRGRLSVAVDEPRPLLPDDAHQLSVDEVRLLWSFVHGDIMDGSTRERLRRSFGLCRRHAWGHAVVEIELWETGSGRRAGHQPFDVSVLLEDLIQEALSAVKPEHPRRTLRAWRGDDACPICRDLSADGRLGLGYAGSDSAALTSEANAMRYTRRWMRETRPLWKDLVCPQCAAPARNADSEGKGGLCRRHAVGLGHVDESVLRGSSFGLYVLPERLRRLIASMTEAGPASTPEEDASWVVALGWLAGWDLPLASAP
ncbi:hypothetical protein [Amnibacterium sp.]|uniref:hypothetical protein n=1 Tax=Amnibacterium sp. TaxID=1872496 RepID=UPI003F7C93DF